MDPSGAGLGLSEYLVASAVPLRLVRCLRIHREFSTFQQKFYLFIVASEISCRVKVVHHVGEPSQIAILGELWNCSAGLECGGFCGRRHCRQHPRTRREQNARTEE